ncbi:hypothetical protein [Bacillus pumilus]|uniref:hypothetical protein n=1 Tax=Bacillus pumilus TaxID=1408 RepID=UPI00081FD516|nr:hypothetical protein [Bacillus pumilus]AOC57544.1 hypothetical protein BEN31_12365 [Bacillus pumilus]MBR0587715.1 hypothetical protein [Bacillus pumilus DW2J2]MBR0616080.1 hypothetical protein [Bacillus pumilus]MBR0625204.1 hypothetical protein [Bacillus pumilus]MCY7724590.1 hypothetical protein [Bacillus pumilus]
MFKLKRGVKFVWRRIKRMLIPSKNLSVFHAQLCIYLFFITLVGAMINQPLYEYSLFFFSSILTVSFAHWFFSYLSFLKFKKDPLYFKVVKQKDYPHQYPEIDNVVNKIDEIESSVMKWAKENDDQNTLAKLKTLNLYHRVSSGRKDLDFLYHSLIVAILGLITSVIFNSNIMTTYKEHIIERYSLVNEYVIYYTDGVIIFYFGVTVALFFLKEKHLMNRKTELYESILDRVISKLDNKESK